jgi:hypothetical protein
MIGAPGRRALDMARRRRGSADQLAPLPRREKEAWPPPLVTQRQTTKEPASAAQAGSAVSPAGDASEEQVERVQNTISPQAVADRVYILLRRDLLWARERGGRR